MKRKLVGVFVIVAMVGMLGGCGCFMQKMKGEAPAPPAQPAKAVAPETKPVVPVPEATKGPGGTTAGAMVPVLADVHFDFDKYNIRPGDAETLKKDYEWFKTNHGKKVRIEGNCDERGTIEYNLVLGQKRADSTKNFLVNLGADGKLIETVSYGKEKPIDPGHNEAAWAKNRRAHMTPLK